MSLKIKEDSKSQRIFVWGRKIRKKWIWQLVVSLWVVILIWVLIGSESSLGGMAKNIITSSLSSENDWTPAIQEVISLSTGDADLLEPMVLPVSGIVTQNFGWSADNGNQENGWHGGIDIKSQKIQPVKAGAAGIVEEISGDIHQGYQVTIKHNAELTSIYGNLARVKVSPNQQIRQGDSIGETGKGEIHFEIRLKGTSVDPLDYLRSSRADV
ncbi:M23 family metallopeptidase [Dehalobacterium formicoaceticum]|uniref:M23 family metallopeptidase n=1 Tax=Dehalobacterium formicoaceticum TaxID=51515 RepID=A0ABT1Y2A0_9FIRM|nr:M23 family metallopeptidase [Dehalobacterium formicoaceticum]MCR6544998.1 M23 family metallopeptidase [Dehalobacterium formicoaceticum]